MGSEWRKVRISDLISEGALVINDGYRAKNSELSHNGLPFARAQNINSGFHFDGADCFPEDTLEKVGIKISQPGDVVFTSKGTVGRIAFVRPETPRFVYAPQLCFWRSLDHDKINPRWLCFWMNSHEFYTQYKGVSGQTDMAEYVSLRDQRAMHITLPPTREQRSIAHILGSLDDKIELNRQMNVTLEGMAQAIFKSWFIDFDPVLDKALTAGNPIPADLKEKAAHRQSLNNQRKPLPPEIAGLFPDSFEDSELGAIPTGWGTGLLGDIAENPRRSIKPKEVSPSTPYIGLQDMPRRCIALNAWGRADEVGSQKSQFKKGEILFGKLRPYFHKVGIAPIDGVCSTDILVIVPKTEQWQSYTLCLVSSKDFVDYTTSHSSGTKMPRTNWKDMSRYPMVFPPKTLLQVFEETISAYTKQILENISESPILERTRDTLIPKLISGELTIPDAKKMVQ